MRAEQSVHTVHAAVRRVFAAFDGAGIPWCLLRGEADLADPTGDIDLLIAASDLPRVDAVVAAEGFLRIHKWGAHRGHVGYDALLRPAPPYVKLKRVFFTVLARTVPPPSLVLLLDLPAEVTARRRPDEDPTALAAARANYLALARRLPQAVVLDADRSPDALRADAVARIWPTLLAGRTGQ